MAIISIAANRNAIGKSPQPLYRQLDGLNLTDLDVEEVQKRELDEAKEYTDETDELKILIEIQHFGGKTNLIDFTEDYCIAIFFASKGSPDKDGRVIFQNRNGNIKNWIRELQNRDSRSRFPRSAEEYICPTT